MEKVTVADLIAIQKGTPLAGINEVLLSGKFAPAPEKPASKRETVIGELTPFEKAVYTARNAADDSLKSVAEANNLMVDKAQEKGETANEAKVRENKRMAELYDDISKVLDALLWTSIKQRLGAPALRHSIGIREGYAIVQIPFSSSIGGMIARSLTLSLLEEALGGEGHRCDTCDKYDECDLPIKKPK